MQYPADPLRQRILATVDAIPRGKVASYGQVAAEAGLPRRARLVGRVLAELGPRTQLAWYRVVNAAGRIALTGAAAREQARRLRAEGVRFDARGRIDLDAHRWRP
jgi:methylated-DNA-protein-cysteine methyltransferase-like protein